MTANDHDIELCEFYLDHEMAADEARTFEGRLSDDASLRGVIDRLRGQRAVRLEAMSTAFDTDAASVERLVASVRLAQASESARRKTGWRPNRAAMAAAASIAFGVIVGGVLQGREGGSRSAAPASHSTPTIVDGNAVGLSQSGLEGHGAYVVSLFGSDGQLRVKYRFGSAEEARRFVETVNGNAGGGAAKVSDAQVLDESY